MEVATSRRKRTSNGSSRHRHDSHESPSREDRKERYRRKSHKRRRHRSRTRSRSRSLSGSPHERRPPVVYMNPAFQQVYGAPGAIQQQQDFEMRSALVSQLSASEQRISSLESELRAAQLARGRAEQTVFDVNAEKLRVEAQNSEIVLVMKTLERAVEDLQKTCGGLRTENERRRRENESLEKSLASCKEQNNFLNERNSTLVKKCEELGIENKTILGRRDESARELAEVRPRLDGMQAELRQKVEESRKMMAQMRSYEEKERIWKKEKMELEKRIEIKDAVATAERKNYDEWKKKFCAEKAELEKKVKLSEPEIQKALDAELIQKTIEDVREYYDGKIMSVLNELEELKKKLAAKENCFDSQSPTCSSAGNLVISMNNTITNADNHERDRNESANFRSSSAPPYSYVYSNCFSSADSCNDNKDRSPSPENCSMSEE